MTNKSKLFFSTQGRKRPHPLDTEKKGMVQVSNDPFGQKCLRHGGLEQDKWEILYSVYGRNNIRFVT